VKRRHYHFHRFFHSLIHSLVHSFIHSFIHSSINLFIDAFIHSLIHSQCDHGESLQHWPCASVCKDSLCVFLGACKRLYKRLRPSDVPMDGWMVHPHITLSVFFSAFCGWIDLKFGRDLHVDLLFQFLFFLFLNSSSNSSFSSFPSSFSSENKFIKIMIAQFKIGCLLYFVQRYHVVEFRS
jgi:hypothetical protein